MLAERGVVHAVNRPRDSFWPCKQRAGASRDTNRAAPPPAMLPSLMNVLRPQSLARHVELARPSQAEEWVFEERCWMERSPDGVSSVMKCQETRRLLQQG